MSLGDKVVGGVFVALGIALIVSGQGFPAGVGGLPGAGFFPQAIGGMMALLAVGLLVKRVDSKDGSDLAASNPKQVAGIAALLLGYLLLWGTGFFAARTAVFLLLALRFLGQKWIPAAGYSAILTAFVYLAFNTGLNVSLD